jgi:hypothetical protein
MKVVLRHCSRDAAQYWHGAPILRRAYVAVQANAGGRADPVQDHVFDRTRW